jgi:hypothetical protein
VKKVFIGHDVVEANFVRDLLERGGVEAEVQGEILSGLRPQIGIGSDTLPSVWIVDDAQLESARELIEDYEQGK